MRSFALFLLIISGLLITTPLQAKDELGWWATLPKEWKTVFKEKFRLRGTVTEAEIQAIWTARSLNLAGRIDIYSLKPLLALTNLEELNCNDTPLTDISTLRKLTKIRVLRLRSTEVTDFSPISSLTQLEKLDVSFTSFTATELLPKLKFLHLLSVRQTPILDISDLKNCKLLDTLVIGSCQIDEVAPIANLARLQYLDISNSRVLNIDTLANLKLLKGLRASKNSIRSVRFAEKLTNLVSLDVSSTLIDDELYPLAKNTSLKVLNIADTPIHSLKNIRHLTELEKLTVTITYISAKDVDIFQQRASACVIER